MPELERHDRNTRGALAVPAPKYRRNLGVWVIVWAMLAVCTIVYLRTISDQLKDEVTAKLNQGMISGAAPRKIPSLVAGSEPLPQAFNHAFEFGERKVDEAKALRDAMVSAEQTRAAWKYHYWDLLFMLSYGMSFLLGARWAWRRADLLGAGAVATTVRILSFVGAPAGAVAVAADLVEFALSASILEGSEIRGGALTILYVAYWIKWAGVAMGSIAVLGGLIAMFSHGRVRR